MEPLQHFMNRNLFPFEDIRLKDYNYCTLPKVVELLTVGLFKNILVWKLKRKKKMKYPMSFWVFTNLKFV